MYGDVLWRLYQEKGVSQLYSFSLLAKPRNKDNWSEPPSWVEMTSELLKHKHFSEVLRYLMK